MLEVVLFTGFGDYKCVVKNAIVQDRYIGYEVHVEVENKEPNRVYPIYSGTCWLIWDINGNLISPPNRRKVDEETAYWKEVKELSACHILVNV
jgi:hypothetical protein